MKILIKPTNETVNLTKNVSESGKTITYHGDISEKSYYALCGYRNIKKNYSPGISYHPSSGDVYVNTGSAHGGTQGIVKLVGPILYSLFEGGE